MSQSVFLALHVVSLIIAVVALLLGVAIYLVFANFGIAYRLFSISKRVRIGGLYGFVAGNLFAIYIALMAGDMMMRAATVASRDTLFANLLIASFSPVTALGIIIPIISIQAIFFQKDSSDRMTMIALLIYSWYLTAAWYGMAFVNLGLFSYLYYGLFAGVFVAYLWILTRVELYQLLFDSANQFVLGRRSALSDDRRRRLLEVTGFQGLP